MRQIEETKRLIAVYRNPNEVIVGTQDEVCSRCGLMNRTTVTAADIGGQIVGILERRLAALRSGAREARCRITKSATGTPATIDLTCPMVGFLGRG